MPYLKFRQLLEMGELSSVARCPDLPGMFRFSESEDASRFAPDRDANGSE